MTQTGFEHYGRLAEIASMFSLISGKTFDESRDIISDTEYGRALAANNPAVMYEQATENLLAIVKELVNKYPEIERIFTEERSSVYLNGDLSSVHTDKKEFSPAEGLKEKQREIIQRAFSELLTQKQDNQKEDISMIPFSGGYKRLRRAKRQDRLYRLARKRILLHLQKNITAKNLFM